MSKKDYEVGYGSPPQHTRFRTGQSGNPKGRMPSHRSLKTELLKELGSRVTIVENGVRCSVSKQTLIIKRLVADAAKGDARAREQLLKLITEIEAVPQADKSGGHARSDADILARFKARLIAELKESGDE